jgi:hypothetical protein
MWDLLVSHPHPPLCVHVGPMRQRQQHSSSLHVGPMQKQYHSPSLPDIEQRWDCIDLVAQSDVGM